MMTAAEEKREDFVRKVEVAAAQVKMVCGVAHPDIIAWGMATDTCLALAASMYESVVQDVERQLPRRTAEVRRIFAPFDLAPVQRLWCRALLSLCPESDEYELEDDERRNIELGVEQLQEAWDNVDTIYQSAATAVEQYDEVFRTKEEMKKVLREVNQQHAAAQKAMREDSV